MKKWNSKGKITVDLLKPISVSNPLFSRETLCSGTLNQSAGNNVREQFAELDVKNWSDVAKNGCAETCNGKILCRLMVHTR
jgi:hypothetical protein